MGLALLLAAGCGQGRDAVDAQLVPLGSCGEIEGLLREAALATMNRSIDQRIESIWSNIGGCGYWGDDDGRFDANAGGGQAPPSGGMPAPEPNASGSSPSEGGEPGQSSGTNNQVAGVDEADFVKNVGKYVYILANGHLRIIEAWPAENARQLSKLAIEGTPLKLFVEGGRALIYSSTGKGSYDECTYGYGCQFTGTGMPTKITVVDVSEPSAPSLVRELWLSSGFVAARRIGDAVYTVLSQAGPRFPGISTYPRYGSGCVNDVFEAAAEVGRYELLRAENTRIIRQTPLTDVIPTIKESVHVGVASGVATRMLTSCDQGFRSALLDGSQLTSVLALRISDQAAPTTATIVSSPGAVYASSSSLYLTVPHARADRGWYEALPDVSEASAVHKFALSPQTAAVRYVGSGLVEGHVLSQFAMDEREGFLRIATSTGRVPNPKVHSTLAVLEQQGDRLVEVGRVGDIAPKEDIRSVRFDGPRAYIVTFKKTDPLYVFDLANPKSPKILGELKIPGFSTYMHMMDENHLLTIGYDAEDKGSFAWFTGILLQIFDVSDPTNPKLAHKEVIGTRGSSSEALTNHLAFTYFAPKKLLALPMTICEDSNGGGSYGTNMTFSGLLAYEVTTATGFTRLGGVPHPIASGIDCHNWWTNATSQVKRSIVMDDVVLSISEQLIKLNRLGDLSTDVATIDLTQ